jgi:hypothetical protein
MHPLFKFQIVFLARCSASQEHTLRLRPPNAPLAMPNPKKHHALVFVRLAHDRRFVRAVLFWMSQSRQLPSAFGTSRSVSAVQRHV